MKIIGLIAGNRSFPLLFAKEAKKAGVRLVVSAVKGETCRSIERYADEVCWVAPGQIRRSIDFFKSEGVEHLVMAGQISPVRIFLSRYRWDDLMLKVVEEIRDFRPHTVFGEIIKTYEKYGLGFISSVTYMEDYLAKEGINNGVVLNDDLKQEIDYAISIAKPIVEMDVGQTIVFKDKAVVAVEALEGTDCCIKRAAKLCGKGILVVKRAKADQDMRFDVPVIGTKTINLLKKYKAKALVVNTEKTLILDKEKVFSIADKAGIPIIGYK